MLHRPARFSIFACDRFRGHLRTGGDAFTVSIRGPSLVWPSLHDNEDGSYEVEWQASVSGVYLVAVMLQVRGGWRFRAAHKVAARPREHLTCPSWPHFP